jgi:glycine/D-amino acid oxidase-like deaminating enzyme
MSKLDYLIVGQGLAGTILDFSFRKNGLHGVVIDNGHKNAASKVGAGVINPLTGRKYVKSWKIDDLLPRAREIYSQLSKLIGVPIYNDRNILRALYSIQEENEWEVKTLLEETKHFRAEADISEYIDLVNASDSYGELTGGMQVHLPVLINVYRKFLEKYKFIVQNEFDYNKLQIDDEQVSYNGLVADQVFFAEGYKVRSNPFFSHLAHEPSKGEALIIKVGDYAPSRILKQKLSFVPFGDGVFWVGAGYQWDFEDEKPSAMEKERLIAILDKNLKVPYKIIDHIAAIRPTVLDRRPFIGHHYEYKNVYIFNGFGTKGASLVPYWAEHLMRHICFKEPISLEVSLER